MQAWSINIKKDPPTPACPPAWRRGTLPWPQLKNSMSKTSSNVVSISSQVAFSNVFHQTTCLSLVKACPHCPPAYCMVQTFPAKFLAGRWLFVLSQHPGGYSFNKSPHLSVLSLDRLDIQWLEMTKWWVLLWRSGLIDCCECLVLSIHRSGLKEGEKTKRQQEATWSTFILIWSAKRHPNFAYQRIVSHSCEDV